MLSIILNDEKISSKKRKNVIFDIFNIFINQIF